MELIYQKKVDFLLGEHYQRIFAEKTIITSSDQYEESKFIQLREKLSFNSHSIVNINFLVVYFIAAFAGFLLSLNILLTVPCYVYIFIFIAVAVNLYYEYKFDTKIGIYGILMEKKR